MGPCTDSRADVGVGEFSSRLPSSDPDDVVSWLLPMPCREHSDATGTDRGGGRGGLRYIPGGPVAKPYEQEGEFDEEGGGGVLIC